MAIDDHVRRLRGDLDDLAGFVGAAAAFAADAALASGEPVGPARLGALAWLAEFDGDDRKEALAEILHKEGYIEGYDAAVLGSAIHERAWLPEAANFVARIAREIGERPVWLFASLEREKCIIVQYGRRKQQLSAM